MTGDPAWAAARLAETVRAARDVTCPACYDRDGCCTLCAGSRHVSERPRVLFAVDDVATLIDAWEAST